MEKEKLALKVNKFIHEQCIDGVPHDIGWNVVKMILEQSPSCGLSAERVEGILKMGAIFSLDKVWTFENKQIKEVVEEICALSTDKPVLSDKEYFNKVLELIFIHLGGNPKNVKVATAITDLNRNLSTDNKGEIIEMQKGGRNRNNWSCLECNESVHPQDNFCSGCGKKFNWK